MKGIVCKEFILAGQTVKSAYRTVILHPLYFSLFLQLKIKLKGRHFETFEAIEAELQAVLNILTEHSFQDAFKKW
jgi:hypothetical protein